MASSVDAAGRTRSVRVARSSSFIHSASSTTACACCDERGQQRIEQTLDDEDQPIGVDFRRIEMHQPLLRLLRCHRNERRPAMAGRELIDGVGRGAESLPDAVARQPQKCAHRFDAERRKACLRIRLETDERQRDTLNGGALLARFLRIP